MSFAIRCIEVVLVLSVLKLAILLLTKLLGE
jgi:hypothetical protein